MKTLATMIRAHDFLLTRGELLETFVPRMVEDLKDFGRIRPVIYNNQDAIAIRTVDGLAVLFLAANGRVYAYKDPAVDPLALDLLRRHVSEVGQLLATANTPYQEPFLGVYQRA